MKIATFSLGCGLVLAASMARGQTYRVDWHTVASGGGSSASGPYQISGTIGQPDTGQTMASGSYSITGGFWAFYAVQSLGAPNLQITLTASNTALVYWPSPSAGFNLAVNTNLNGTNWVAPPQAVNDNGTIKYIIVSPPAGDRFYQLKN
jgi:hypothetical protein